MLKWELILALVMGKQLDCFPLCTNMILQKYFVRQLSLGTVHFVLVSELGFDDALSLFAERNYIVKREQVSMADASVTCTKLLIMQHRNTQ